MDPDNYGYYSDFIICNEGYVYNSENNMCIEVTVTKCRYPGDVSDNCISCPDETPYISDQPVQEALTVSQSG